MKVKVMNRLYQMSQKEYQGLLQVAKEQVPLGIYAIEKQGYAELRCDQGVDTAIQGAGIQCVCK